MYIPQRAHLDLETFAQSRDVRNEEHGRLVEGVDLIRDGTFNYARHPATGCYLFGVKLDSQPTFVVQLWRQVRTPAGWHWMLKPQEELFGQYPLLINFLAGMAAGVPVIAHNAAFERLVWNNVLRRGNRPSAQTYYPNWPELKLSQQVCTMARANAMSLPAGLENLANVLGLQNRKGDSTLMKLLAMSAPNVSAAVTPEALEELGAYCAQDVETEAEIDRKLYPLSPSQQELWILDQEINGRGIPVDVVAIRRALKVVDAARELANARLAELTGGAVKTAQQNAALAGWLRDQGHPDIASVAAFTLKSYGEDVGWTPADKAGTEEGVAARELIEEVLELREVAAKSSVAKLQAVLDQLRLTDDARVRHQFLIWGAGTGRWVGRGFQPQNIKRFDDENEQETADKLFAILNDDVFWGSAETPGEFLQAAGIAARRIQEETGQNAIKAISACMRIFIKAPEAK
jgi:DNA polymerase bacteriophage-type